jgi:DNA-binding transcriptional MerR regulator
MMTVNEVSKLTGVSIRTLQYYDKIGLLNPAKCTESGYRLYDNANLQKLQQILLFRELEFSLKEIGFIIDSPDFDRRKALDQQIQLLTLKKEHLDNLITFARGINLTGEENMNFSSFDTTKIDEYAKEAKAKWGDTVAYKEFSEKSKGRSKEVDNSIANGLMTIFADFGKIKDKSPASSEAQSLVKKLQSYITENYYTCTLEILNSLGLMYSAGGDFTDNIDNTGGVGTAQFATQAISIYCK